MASVLQSKLCLLFCLVFCLVAAWARGATVIHPNMPELDIVPVWLFIAGAKLEVGDVVLCRSDTDAESPWFITAVLSIEEGNTIMIMKPVGHGVSIMAQLPMAQVLDVARKLER